MTLRSEVHEQRLLTLCSGACGPQPEIPHETDLTQPSQGAQQGGTCLPVQETRVQSQGQEDPQEEAMATYSSVPTWRIPWTEEPGGLRSTGSQSQM